MPRYLILANQTASSSELLSAVQKLIQQHHDSDFVLLVPATPGADLLDWQEGDDQTIAKRTAQAAKDALAGAGANIIRAEVGDPSPVKAIEDELTKHSEKYEAIIISTLPLQRSRWVALDQPRRIERRFKLPVIHVVGHSVTMSREELINGLNEDLNLELETILRGVYHAAAGARLAFTYQGERLKENVEELAGTFGGETLILPCDVTKDEEIGSVFRTVGEKLGRLHLLLHSVAFAPKEALEGEFLNTGRDAFRTAHDVSAYSLVALARAAAPLMVEGGSIVAMTYYGSEKVVPHYNVMGVAKASLEASTRYLAYDLGPKKIRVNCISAGPVNTLAARGISGFTEMLKHYEAHAPLKRNVAPSELGATGLFLASDGAAAITGQVLYVDCGYQIMGM